MGADAHVGLRLTKDLVWRRKVIVEDRMGDQGVARGPGGPPHKDLGVRPTHGLEAQSNAQ